MVRDLLWSPCSAVLQETAVTLVFSPSFPFWVSPAFCLLALGLPPEARISCVFLRWRCRLQSAPLHLETSLGCQRWWFLMSFQVSTSAHFWREEFRERKEVEGSVGIKQDSLRVPRAEMLWCHHTTHTHKGQGSHTSYPSFMGLISPQQRVKMFSGCSFLYFLSNLKCK